MNINATFFAELLAFCIFVFITYRYIWPSMANLLEERRQEIADGLEAASQSQRKLEEASEESIKIVNEAKTEASTLISQAGSRADQVVEEAKDQATDEAKKIKDAASADIEQSTNRAKEGLKDEVAALVLAGAQKILDKEIDEESNKEIIDSLIKEI
tara:strand:- start:333 stop:803 length:471 start_codon:yes stop_codon:yes gene_type:complete